MSEMIERVAKELAWADLLEHETVEGLEAIGVFKDGMFVDAKFIAAARTAIEAMREPTLGMSVGFMAARGDWAWENQDDPNYSEWYGTIDEFAADWSAAIDAALKPAAS